MDPTFVRLTLCCCVSLWFDDREAQGDFCAPIRITTNRWFNLEKSDSTANLVAVKSQNVVMNKRWNRSDYSSLLLNISFYMEFLCYRIIRDKHEQFFTRPLRGRGPEACCCCLLPNEELYLFMEISGCTVQWCTSGSQTGSGCSHCGNWRLHSPTVYQFQNPYKTRWLFELYSNSKLVAPTHLPLPLIHCTMHNPYKLQGD